MGLEGAGMVMLLAVVVARRINMLVGMGMTKHRNCLGG